MFYNIGSCSFILALVKIDFSFSTFNVSTMSMYLGIKWVKKSHTLVSVLFINQSITQIIWCILYLTACVLLHTYYVKYVLCTRGTYVELLFRDYKHGLSSNQVNHFVYLFIRSLQGSPSYLDIVGLSYLHLCGVSTPSTAIEVRCCIGTI